MTGKFRRNAGDKMSATDRDKTSDIVTEDMHMTDTGTITVISMSATIENNPPDTTVVGRSSKVPTTIGPDKVTGTKNASNKNVT